MRINGVAPTTAILRVTAECSYTLGTTLAPLAKTDKVKLKHQFTYTNIPAGFHSMRVMTSDGDPLPTISDADDTGVARYIQEYLSVLRYRGSVTIQKEDVGADLSLGNTLNIVGVSGEPWANMAGLIQSISWDIGSGTTQIAFGFPEHLGLTDLVDYLRCFRDRQRWTNGLLQNEGKL